MEPATLTETVLRLIRDNEPWVEFALFLLAFGESIVLFSFFIPASILFLAVGGLQSASGGDLWPLVLAGTAGAFVGDIVSYWIGWRYRHDLPTRWPFRTNPAWIPNAKRFFDRWGLPGIILAKFVGPMRPLVPTISGAVSMPTSTFLVASAVSSLVWSLVFLVPTFYGVEWMMTASKP